jgi:stearoyl-CoA desaturase (delta-9 desaturase)
MQTLPGDITLEPSADLLREATASGAQKLVAEPARLVKRRAAFFNSKTLARNQSRVALVTVVLPIVGLAGAIAYLATHGVAPFYVGLWVFMHFVGMTGISVGYHRLGAHRSFRPHSIVKKALLIFGSLSAQGPVIYWVSNHRRHHEKCDKTGDVHSPHVAENGTVFSNKLKGFWEGHTGWMFHSNPSNPLRYSQDLLEDPEITFVNQYYYVWIALGLLVPGLVSLLVYPTIEGFLLGVLFGGFARLCSVQHVTWAINSWTHMFGARPYQNSDNSTNALWLAIPTVGEGWHNNHHSFPYSARLGLQWWQIDLGYMLLLTLSAVGLVRDIREPTEQAKRARRRLVQPS